MQSATQAEPLPVLVVDDDSALIRTLADILRLHGYAPQTALSGREGLALAEHNAPALAVVDLRLPDMDGVELASRLHAMSELTQVVVLTGNASVESAVAAMRERSIDYLVKPVQIDKLLQVVSMAGERWQRRVAEEKLRQSDERFRRVVESDMLGIMFYDIKGEINDANDEFLRMLGYSRHDLEAGELDWRAMTPPEYHQRDREKATELLHRGVIAAYEKEYFRKDGSRLPVLIGATTLADREATGVAFVLDISDRKAAERALALRARQQECVADFGQRALASDDVGALMSEAVALVARMLDVPMSRIMERRGDGQPMVCRASVGFASEAKAGVANPPAGTTMVDVVIPGAAQPFGVLQVFGRSTRSFSQDDTHFLTAIAHVLGTTVDRHRTERAFRQSQRLEAVGRLASGVAHDFNNMLSAMTGYTEMVIQDLAADDPHKDDLQEVLRAAGRAAALTRQLLAFSREQVMKPRLLSLNDVVVGMEKLLHRLIGDEIDLSLHLDPDLEWVKADPGQLEQVLLNLCVNARDAMPKGGRVTIETANTTLDPWRTQEHSLAPQAYGDFVMLAVTDTGVGMDAETRARIFEPFFTTKGPEKGTGLGLATVYGIVKQSAGEIFVYSEPGHGTSFKIFLPRSTEIPGSAQPAARDPQAAPGHETILLAEDEEAIRTIVQRSLAKRGYEVLVAFDGEDALRLIRSYATPIHLLITDMVMPNMSGSELAKRARLARPDLRVLFLSGFTAASMIGGNAMGSGDFFLQKPFGPDALLSKVREVLDSAAPR